MIQHRHFAYTRGTHAHRHSDKFAMILIFRGKGFAANIAIVAWHGPSDLGFTVGLLMVSAGKVSLVTVQVAVTQQVTEVHFLDNKAGPSVAFSSIA